ncbi:unnamed protein product [Zymoseptoria tritici ST99CH_1A5]|uniref:Phosducin domain-containing protein n=4 Tax=Zymoseptoria tritici TaxID=1047171 RepID=F9X1S9_ZYMTI|nr:uncharacterized protein MYCGRDRAFT_108250 [Zymoseptoria tritici IPO323]SMQ48009.1 unnamed protein product [Zymoseptoria tritici ST99CH_3D7]SMR46551.1 unnamed protein product [Zymoseptoria tritici ST99CH_1E4]SMR47795.1 unnamed protein product [Zymoseptoria tritici ST99CH_3D1]SMY21699.1 unnamed protein product [Zymoseptoria tritici ST99CH_1A5]EGP90343.1 hypothetical protein MYCGRDRAFT_108250 [Zymoseptoria tritici IPO323]
MSAAENEFQELMRDKSHRKNHPDDDSDARSTFLFADDEEDETPRPSIATESRPSVSLARNKIPSKRYGANTGPKGVISDAQDWRDSVRKERSSISLRRYGGQQNGFEPTLSQPLSEEDEDEEFEDEDFMQRWRKSRLTEMKSGPRTSKLHQNSQNRTIYGGLTAVDAEGYLDAVDNSPSDIVVVVYIYDEYSHISQLFENCLRNLATKHPRTRFVKLHYDDAEMEPAGVPAIIAYRGGDKFAGLVPLMAELPDDAELDATTVESVLKRHQILH